MKSVQMSAACKHRSQILPAYTQKPLALGQNCFQAGRAILLDQYWRHPVMAAAIAMHNTSMTTNI